MPYAGCQSTSTAYIARTPLRYVVIDVSTKKDKKREEIRRLNKIVQKWR